MAEFSDDDFYDDSVLFTKDSTCDQTPTTSTDVGFSRPRIDAIAPPIDVLKKLKKYFGHSDFRPYQWDIIKNAINGIDQLVIMSTGYGKSICYQMPSLIDESLTLIVSPLISLMEDQVLALKNTGIIAHYISGNNGNKNEIVELARRGELRLLYITPEMCLVATSFLDNLKPYIKLIAIDEAHCVSAWGHEFRPTYRDIACLRKVMPKVPFMAVTATATPPVKKDIIDNLKLRDPKVICTGLDRKNLFFRVFAKRNYTDDLDPLLKEDKILGPCFGGPTIVYCQTREEVDQINKYLRNVGVRSAPYHAGLSAHARTKAHNEFAMDKVSTVVATVAFGMGIDKKDVRTIIHYGAPKSIEGYYQEAGRAGRDGAPSECLIFTASNDMKVTRSRILNDKFMKEEYKKTAINMASAMEKYLVTLNCRRILLLQYFDPNLTPTNEVQLGCCDNCEQMASSGCVSKSTADCQVNFGEEARMLLESLENVFRGRFGLTVSLDFLRGKDKTYDQYKKHPLFGAGKGKTDGWWKELAKVLRLNHFLIEEPLPSNKFAHIIKCTNKAKNWLLSGTKDLLLEPTPALLIAKVRGDIPTKAKTIIAIKDVPVEAPVSKLLNPIKKRDYLDCSKYESLAVEVDESGLNALQNIPKLKDALLDLRFELAARYNQAANNLIPNVAMEYLITIRPTTPESLEHVEGLSEGRRNQIGDEILRTIASFCHNMNMPTNCIKRLQLPDDLVPLKDRLPTSISSTYEAHVYNRYSLEQVAKHRGLSSSTCSNHLNDVIKFGLPVHLDVLGVNLELMDAVMDVVRKNDSDITRMKPLFEKFSDGFIDYNRLKLILEIFKYEYGIVGNDDPHENFPTSSASHGSMSSGQKRKIPTWMTSYAVSTGISPSTSGIKKPKNF